MKMKATKRSQQQTRTTETLHYPGDADSFRTLLVQAGIKHEHRELDRFHQYRVGENAQINFWPQSRKRTVTVTGEPIAAQALLERLTWVLEDGDADGHGHEDNFENVLCHLALVGLKVADQEESAATLRSGWWGVEVYAEDHGQNVIGFTTVHRICPNKACATENSLAYLNSQLCVSNVHRIDRDYVELMARYEGEYDVQSFATFVMGWWQDLTLAIGHVGESK